MPEWTYFPWFAWIPILGIVVWGILAMSGILGGGRKNNEQLAKALEENAAVNKALLDRLDTIDGRLGAVEKTLNDIP